MYWYFYWFWIDKEEEKVEGKICPMWTSKHEIYIIKQVKSKNVECFLSISFTSRKDGPRLSKNTPLAKPLIPFTTLTPCSIYYTKEKSQKSIKMLVNKTPRFKCNVGQLIYVVTNLPLKYGSHIVPLQYIFHRCSPGFLLHCSSVTSLSKRLPSTHILQLSMTFELKLKLI